MRVLVMRPAPESATLAASLEALGYRVAVAPVTQIVPLPVELPVGRWDALLVTSGQACAALGEAVRERLRDKPVFAVGRTTAAAARQAGFTDLRIAGGDAAALGDLLRLMLRPPAQVLYLAGRVRKPELEVALAAEGYRVTPVETYDAVPVPWSAAVCDDLQADPPGAVLHFSRQSAARALAESERRGLAAMFAAACHVCLSADVAEVVTERSYRAVVAERPGSDSLLQALVASVAP